MEGDWPEGRAQWWWKYVMPYSRWGEERMGHPVPWHVSSGWAEERMSYPVPWRPAGPSPEPWRVVVSQLLSEVSLKEVADRMPEGEEQNRLRERYDGRISEIIDDFCGTGRRPPIPIPGPRPWVLPAVEQLAAAAHSLQEGSMREEVLRVAGELAQKGLSE